MKRKLLAALCVTAMSAGLLAGCGSSEKAEDTSKSQETSAEDTSEQESKTDTKTESGTSDSDEAVSEKEAEEAGFSDGSESESADSSDTESKDADQESTDAAQGVLLDTSKELTGTHHAEIEVKDYGTIEVELDADSAPVTVTNFVKLAQDGFYDGLTFHRIIDGFMIQGGDPNGDGTGGSDENIKGEFSNNGVENNILPYKRHYFHGKSPGSGQWKLSVLYCTGRQHLPGWGLCRIWTCNRGNGYCG